MRYAAPHHVPAVVHPKSVAGVEGLLQEGQHQAAPVRVREEGGPREANGEVGAPRVRMAGGLRAVLEVVGDLDAVVVLEPG
jgi:hypothetical protein